VQETQVTTESCLNHKHLRCLESLLAQRKALAKKNASNNLGSKPPPVVDEPGRAERADEIFGEWQLKATPST